MPSADLGPVNPLPPIFGPHDVHAAVAGVGIDDEMARGLTYGAARSVLPYLSQDGYGRELAEVEHPVAVLENEHVRATFLIALGGRLWSLIDKRSGRELLHVNPVFQPANLALRNAWFAGGVEWNLGTTGHWPLTCSPLHVARVERGDGAVSLRMYEYERMRGLVVCIEASLPDDAPLLTVRVTISNPRTTAVPVYWWSNIAVPERDDVRVIAPATSAWHFGYGDTLSSVPFPLLDDSDRSYTTRARDAADYFFDLRNAQLPWITALDGEGRGLFHASTSRLRGRKLFLWGTGPGSEHWQRWLGDGSSRYLEIQAGLARTQLEHLPMPAGESWSWVEAYGLAEADAAATHSSDWQEAVEAAQRAVAASGAAEVIAREERRDASRDRITQVLARASGWGALEEARRGASGEPPLSTAAAPFAAADLGPEQAWWVELLGSSGGRHARNDDTNDAPSDAAGPGSAPSVPPGNAPSVPPDSALSIPPAGYQTDDAWLGPLRAVDTPESHLHAGVILANAGDVLAAEREWRASLEKADNGWAHRNLAQLYVASGKRSEAAAEYELALRQLPGVAQLAVEAARFLVESGRCQAALDLIETLPDEQRSGGRIRFFEARASLKTGDLARCAALLDAGIEIPDIKEGEVSLDALWTEFHQRRLAAEAGSEVTDAIRARVASAFPPPERYDFRMHAEPLP